MKRLFNQVPEYQGLVFAADQRKRCFYGAAKNIFFFLHINTSHVIYQLLNEQKKKGVAVVCVIEDLDVVLELCDRIAVLCGGKISGVVDGRTATKEGIGLLMTKHEKGGVVNE